MAIPTYTLPNTRMVRVVIREDADIFTILFPMRIVLSIFGESEMTFSRMIARLSPCSDRACILILFTVVMDVSAEEKKAESAINIRTVIA